VHVFPEAGFFRPNAESLKQQAGVSLIKDDD
jgi:hypothetical protein